MGDHLKAALYFEECAEQEPRPAERERLLRAARQFRWLAIAEASRSGEASGDGLAGKRRDAEINPSARIAGDSN
jgi:hypothetical protein